MDVALAVGEQGDDGIEDPVIEELQGAREVLDGGAREAVEDMRVGSIRRPAVVLGDRVLKLRRKLGAQLLLEARKTGKADLLGQT